MLRSAISAVLVFSFLLAIRSVHGFPGYEPGQTKLQRSIAPGYYSQECNASKQCKDPVKYCHMFLCVDCLKENVACTQKGQCCPGSECVYGRCNSGASLGSAGTFCDRQSDCKNPDLCCVRESSINPITSICKPALDEHQTCEPYNQYRTVYVGGTVQPACGPCKQGLTCKQVGIFGVHQVCLPEASAASAPAAAPAPAPTPAPAAVK